MATIKLVVLFLVSFGTVKPVSFGFCYRTRQQPVSCLIKLKFLSVICWKELIIYVYSCIIPSKGMKVIVLFFLCGIFPHIQYTSRLRAIYGVIKLSYYVTVKFPHGILQELTIFKLRRLLFATGILNF